MLRMRNALWGVCQHSGTHFCQVSFGIMNNYMDTKCDRSVVSMKPTPPPRGGVVRSVALATCACSLLSSCMRPRLRVSVRGWGWLGTKSPRCPIPTASRTTGRRDRLSSLRVHFSSGSGKWTGVVLSTDNIYRLRVYNSSYLYPLQRWPAVENQWRSLLSKITSSSSLMQ